MFTQYIYSFAWIFSSLLLGNTFQTLTEVPIPGSIIGMIILFSAMVLGWCDVKLAGKGCQILMKNIPILIIPVSVGLMTHYDLLIANMLPILVSTVGGSIIVLIGLALLIDKIARVRE